MKKLLFAVSLSVLVAGCTWAEVEEGSEKTQSISEKAQIVATAVAPYTGGYGALAATLAGAVGTVAGALAAFAKGKKAKKIAAAAVEAANSVSGGGQAIVNAAVGNGVAGDIRDAYNLSKK